MIPAENHRPKASIAGLDSQRPGAGRFFPVVGDFLFAEAPLPRSRGVQPVKRLATTGSAAGQGSLHGGAEGGLLFRLDRPRINRNEQRRAAAGHQVEKLPVEVPRRLIGVGGAVGVADEERAVLRQAEGERVDAHPPGAFPNPARGIITGALDFEESGAEVANGIASQEDAVASPGAP